MVRRIHRRRGLPRLRREACNYRPQPPSLPLSREGWLFHLPAPNLAGFGVLRRCPGSIISRGGITVSAVAGFRAAPLAPAFWRLSRGAVLRCSIVISILWSIHHIYVV